MTITRDICLVSKSHKIKKSLYTKSESLKQCITVDYYTNTTRILMFQIYRMFEYN